VRERESKRERVCERNSVCVSVCMHMSCVRVGVLVCARVRTCVCACVHENVCFFDAPIAKRRQTAVLAHT